MTLKDKLMIYVYRKGNQIEQEEKDLKTSLRLSALDNLDHYEILLLRIQAWNEFINEPFFNISPNYTKYSFSRIRKYSIRVSLRS